jgi:hypothetical protein
MSAKLEVRVGETGERQRCERGGDAGGRRNLNARARSGSIWHIGFESITGRAAISDAAAASPTATPASLAAALALIAAHEAGLRRRLTTSDTSIVGSNHLAEIASAVSTDSSDILWEYVGCARAAARG